uniref:AAA+ ATPase domain-containing protein n=1 Tax=Rhodosorus marinus TaxID=101924 RepID=A0A7S3EKG4_9RHOD|mmetsp:Transcript_43365/g.169704  ORF Transcript_43365/g.169704 Transcript_43365/m.169704 type:complete len:737 (+) Transcript_43365:317-2527(+)|eukprot:CAMPEP_0113964190 /NCGR_PEP_ID=MMETSP0011_2-20120614/6986_1 /TAXON_ID=101924 /ORGANISM="Rhodosorus marinus" /LENGTH=736 /DNA_ID=CAMNT_0000976433 /DNA_START=223 /DNA_END=2433 /DNA_ORIENTATION=- /assembly_acc=CAM_ASM_000156
MACPQALGDKPVSKDFQDGIWHQKPSKSTKGRNINPKGNPSDSIENEQQQHRALTSWLSKSDPAPTRRTRESHAVPTPRAASLTQLTLQQHCRGASKSSAGWPPRIKTVCNELAGGGVERPPGEHGLGKPEEQARIDPQAPESRVVETQEPPGNAVLIDDAPLLREAVNYPNAGGGQSSDLEKHNSDQAKDVFVSPVLTRVHAGVHTLNSVRAGGDAQALDGGTALLLSKSNKGSGQEEALTAGNSESPDETTYRTQEIVLIEEISKSPAPSASCDDYHPFFSKRKTKRHSEPESRDSHERCSEGRDAWECNNATVHVGAESKGNQTRPRNFQLQGLSEKMWTDDSRHRRPENVSEVKLLGPQKRATKRPRSVPTREELLVKYRPKTLTEIPSKCGIEVFRWLESWYRDGSKVRRASSKARGRCPALVLSGPPGCGKTSTVYAVAGQLGFVVHEINAGICRTGKRTLSEVSEVTSTEAIRSGSEINRNVLILFEEVDQLAEDERGFWQSLQTLCETRTRPIIVTCNDYIPIARKWDFKPIWIHMTEVGETEIRAILSRINFQENLDVSPDVLSSIASVARGDLRSAINALSFEALSGQFELGRQLNTGERPTTGFFYTPPDLDLQSVIAKRWMLAQITSCASFLEYLAFCFSGLDLEVIGDDRCNRNRAEKVFLKDFTTHERKTMTSIQDLERTLGERPCETPRFQRGGRQLTTRAGELGRRNAALDYYAYINLRE